MKAEKSRKALLQQAELTDSDWTPTQETQERYYEFIKRMYNETSE